MSKHNSAQHTTHTHTLHFTHAQAYITYGYIFGFRILLFLLHFYTVLQFRRPPNTRKRAQRALSFVSTFLLSGPHHSMVLSSNHPILPFQSQFPSVFRSPCSLVIDISNLEKRAVFDHRIGPYSLTTSAQATDRMAKET